MKALALFLLGATACATDATDPDDFPVTPAGAQQPQGGGGGGGGGASAAYAGRVCVNQLVDDFGACSSSGAGGLQVALGDQVATTADDGTFMFETMPQGSNLGFSVTGAGIVPSSSPFTPSTTIPAIDADAYEDLVLRTGLTPSGDTGAIIGSAMSAASGEAASGFTLGSTPTGDAGVYYYGDEGFSANATGHRGVFWVPGLTAGATDLSFGSSSGGETLVNGVQVINGGVTILDSVVLP